jgi:hypothetical protein
LQELTSAYNFAVEMTQTGKAPNAIHLRGVLGSKRAIAVLVERQPSPKMVCRIITIFRQRIRATAMEIEVRTMLRC